jgi:hypothetical protein
MNSRVPKVREVAVVAGAKVIGELQPERVRDDGTNRPSLDGHRVVPTLGFLLSC